MSGLSEKHRELKRRRAEIVAKMGAIVKEDSDDKPIDEAQGTVFDELAASLAAIDQRLQRVAAAMQAAAEGAQDADATPTVTAIPTIPTRAERQHPRPHACRSDRRSAIPTPG